MRTFDKFDLRGSSEARWNQPSNAGFEVTEESFADIREIRSLGNTFHDFVRGAPNLVVFNPGLFLMDRSFSFSVYRKPVSLSWTNNAQTLISLVDTCRKLTVLNLEGYQVLIIICIHIL